MPDVSQLILLVTLIVFPLIFITARKGVLALPETPNNDPHVDNAGADGDGDEDEDAQSGDQPDEHEHETSNADDPKPKSIMQPEKSTLEPARDDPFTLEELQTFDGSDPEKPIYVAIKGTVFDVTAKKDMYGPGKSYNIFAGKDGSKGLGLSSLKVEDAVPDFTDLPENEMKTLNEWHQFFSKRYNIVGKVTNLPESVQRFNKVNEEEASL